MWRQYRGRTGVRTRLLTGSGSSCIERDDLILDRASPKV